MAQRNGQVLQRRKGLRLHRLCRRWPGRLRALTANITGTGYRTLEGRVSGSSSTSWRAPGTRGHQRAGASTGRRRRRPRRRRDHDDDADHDDGAPTTQCRPGTAAARLQSWQRGPLLHHRRPSGTTRWPRSATSTRASPARCSRPPARAPRRCCGRTAPASGDHFYTTSAAERDNAVAKVGYVNEGVACHVLPGRRHGHHAAAAGVQPHQRGPLLHHLSCGAGQRGGQARLRRRGRRLPRVPEPVTR